MMRVLLAIPPLILLAAAPSERAPSAADPDLGPNVTVFDASTPTATIQRALDSAFALQERSQFGPHRTAFLFKSGRYHVNARVGFYTQISGLGLSPDDVQIDGGIRADAKWRANGNATLNFWRAVENMAITPDSGFDRWAVSQAAPLRRVHIRGDLVLDDGGWSSGGFLADSRVDGDVRSGSQQQWLTRNSALGRWTGSNWNMVFVGTTGAPANSFPTPPYTTVDATPVVREKPFLYMDARRGWSVFVPARRTNSHGTTWEAGEPRGVSFLLSTFEIIRPDSTVNSTAVMNAALARGKHLLITPGVYHMDAPLHITRANTIVLGLGLATLVADNGTTAIHVDDVDGVTIAGLLVDAGTVESPVLVRVGARCHPGRSEGTARCTRHTSNPTLLADVFVRIGGVGPASAATSVEINSNDVIADHLWLWRADHGAGAGWSTNPAATGLVVNGANVTVYALFVEHYQKHQVEWNGDSGRTYFFQNEMPYDVPSQEQWMAGDVRGFDAYHVDSRVTQHEAWGFGSYCFFNRNPSVVAEHAFSALLSRTVRFHHMVTVSLGGGKGTIAHVINDLGASAAPGAVVQKLVEAP
jgi:hypothetical protein